MSAFADGQRLAASVSPRSPFAGPSTAVNIAGGTSVLSPSYKNSPTTHEPAQAKELPGRDAGTTASDLGTINESISITLNEAVGAASISPSGRDVCLAARKGLFIVDLDDPWATPRFLPHYSTIVSDVQWSPHPSRAHWVVSTSGNKGLVWNLNISSGYSPIEFVTIGHERSITDMNWAVFDSDLLATCGIDGNILCYDMRAGSTGHRGMVKPVTRYCGWRYGATQVKWNRQNQHELASSHGEFVYIWDDRYGSRPVIEIKAHSSKIYGIDYSRTSKAKLVTCSLDTTVKYWDLQNVSKDDGAVVQEPSQIIQTSSPVWRARHTPFGDGIVTLPQRSEYSVKIWSAPTTTAPSNEVFRLTGHMDIVREFLWRTKGGSNADDDDRQFQLVTWGADNQLLLTPIPESITTAVGHVPHSPIRVRRTRLNAENRSFREVLSSSSNFLVPGSSDLSHSGNSPLSMHSSGGLHSAPSSGGLGMPTGVPENKMTPPSIHPSHHTPSNRIPMTSSSRYGRSANSGGAGSISSSSAAASLGTSPADYSRGLMSLRESATSGEKENKLLQARQKKVRHAPTMPAAKGVYMTRNAIRKPGGQDAVTWMEGVRIVSAGQNTITVGEDGGNERADANALIENASSLGDRDSVPLHEELTSVARAYETKVRFEKIAVTTRMLVVALYGPWAASGLSTFLRATFTFPPGYPSTSLALDIERSSSITNKARAKLIAGVRGLAARYALKKQNSLEACLICLLGGQIIEPENEDINDDTIDAERHNSALRNSVAAGLAGATHLVVRNLDGEEDEEGTSDSDASENLERMLANRNCPPPRRCGAVFSPTGLLFSFQPLESFHANGAGHTERRQRSASPASDRRVRQRRRRLFDSFGVIPSLQARRSGLDYSSSMHGGHDYDGNVIVAQEEEDSDEELNKPSLLMSQRRQSFNRSESAVTSQHASHHRVAAGRSSNSRIFINNVAGLLGVDTTLPTSYVLQGSISTLICQNASFIAGSNAPWVVKRAWAALLAISEASISDGSIVNGKLQQPYSRPLILGERLPEKLMMDMLEIFIGLGDIQMLGLLGCILELDRRILKTAKPPIPRKVSRSPGQSGALDYFSLKPARPSRSTASQLTRQQQATYPSLQQPTTPLGASLKSPNAWLMSSSYGTQTSSAGSSAKGSSWANNLSTFFKTANASSIGQTGKSTPPSGDSNQNSPASLSPAFVKKAAVAPLTEMKRVGGIASGRPVSSSGKARSATHVSFATSTTTTELPNDPQNTKLVAPQTNERDRKKQIGIKIVVHATAQESDIKYRSVLLTPRFQLQLEHYRLLFSQLLHRLQLHQQHAQVLKLTSSAEDSRNRAILHAMNGILEPLDQGLSFQRACKVCGNLLSGRAPGHCGNCKSRSSPAPCALCHMPLDSLVETCLKCLHTCHLNCLQDWRENESACPAACGCECTRVKAEELIQLPDPIDIVASFKSPPLIG